jgi:AcrR family transcriptional regulator
VLGDATETEARARPDRRSQRREATKAEILDAAWALVREHGLGALSLRDLAARVGMRAPSLYQYFASKHAIYDAMFEQGAREALATISAPSDVTGAHERFRDQAHRFFDFAIGEPARAQLLFLRTIPDFEPTPEAFAPAMQLLEYTRAEFAAYGITDPDAVDLWTALMSGLINQQLANDPGGTRWERLIDRAVDIYLSNVLPSKSRKRGS